MIYRETAKRLIAVKFSVRGRDLAGAVAEAREKTEHLFQPPYRAVWSGEFEQMQDAQTRLLWIVPVVAGADLGAFSIRPCDSWLDAVVVLGNVCAALDGRRLGALPDGHERSAFPRPSASSRSSACPSWTG